MPDKNKLNLLVANSVQDISQVRLPGIDKPFEKLTIGELVQLRPGSEVAASWNVTAVTDNATISSSSMLEELGRLHGLNAMRQVINQERLGALRTELAPQLEGRIGLMSAEEQVSESQQVRLTPSEEDVFSTEFSRNPFKT